MEALVPDIFVHPTGAYQDQAGVVGKGCVPLKSTSGCRLGGRGESKPLEQKSSFQGVMI